MRTLLMITFMLSANPLFSQQTREDTIAKIISYGLRVYAKDTITFKEGVKIIDSLSKGITKIDSVVARLKKEPANNQLKLLGAKVEEFKKEATKSNSTNHYQPLVKKTKEAFLGGGKEPEAKRLRRDSIHIFLDSVNAYLKIVDSSDDNKKKDGTTGGSGQGGETIIIDKTLSIFAIALAGLSLLGIIAVLLIFYKKDKSYDASRKRHRADIEQLKTDINQLRNNSPINGNANTKSDLVSDQRIQELEKRIALLENKQQRTAEVVPSQKGSSESTAPMGMKKADNQIKNAPETLYAKRPDLDNGFSQSELVTIQDGDQVYQIEVKDNTATFIITNDLKAQKYALSDFRYYLEKACEFLNDPTPNCRIDTKAYGELIKDGGKWIIKSKAQIMFV